MLGVTIASAAFRCSQSALVMMQRSPINKAADRRGATRNLCLIERVKRATPAPFCDLALAQDQLRGPPRHRS